MLFRFAIAAAILLALSAAPGPATAARAAKPKLDPITDLMRIHGQPDSVDMVGRHNRAYHWRLTTDVGFEDDKPARRESFTCNVTALVSPSGRILRIAAEPVDPGAAAIASVGRFGPLCEKRFGMRPHTARGTTPRAKAR
ncbi:hypothetical protein QRQ56_16680 [Bradyrhizobium sp. U531]|uniref:hypothetical protein n=1 Tax=Bradyrhizobium sp. U531 TaxID=3053458 RepID=UPI003F430EFC